MTPLSRMQLWYSQQCNGEWEHHRGVLIQSCDNPGWWVKIDLAGTTLEDSSFERIAENVDSAGFQQGQRWLDCKVADGIWHGAGDETKLEHILDIFLSWAESQGS
jgi:hypothetical protein